MHTDTFSIKKIVSEFTSQTFGAENPEGLSFSTCFPISILLDLNQIENSISCGNAPRNNSIVNHFWLTIDHEGTILDPTIQQFDPTMESIYVEKINENEVTRKYVPIASTYQDWFMSAYNICAEPLINKQPRTFRKDPAFERKMNLINIKTATVLYAYISKMESINQTMASIKCTQYFSPIFTFLKNKSETDSNFIVNLKNEMPQDFTLLLSRALSN